MTPRPRYVVTVLPSARDTIAAAAAAALPMETGGILIGWRGGGRADGCTVARAVEVPDARAGRSTYQRNHSAADVAMQQVLDRLCDSELGYVGEWHSHPQDQPPSPQDRGSVCGVARLAGNAVVLVVPSLVTRVPPTWAWHTLVARRTVSPRVITVRSATLRMEDQ